MKQNSTHNKKFFFGGLSLMILDFVFLGSDYDGFEFCDNKPCPFCGQIPVFSGKPIDRDDRRYYVLKLPCECHDIEIYAGSWSAYKDCKTEGEWLKVAAEIASRNWNESFRIQETE